MAGAKRRSYKKKGVSRRRKSGYTKRKSTKKVYRKRRASKKRTYRKRTYRRTRRSKGPSLMEMAFVVSNHHPDKMAVDNSQTLANAAAAAAAQMKPPVGNEAYQDIMEDKEDF